MPDVSYDDRFPRSVLEFSETATRKGIPNAIPDYLNANAARLSRTVGLLASAVQAQYQARIHVNSGYRCPQLNVAVGGAANSDHVVACAADLIVPGVDNRELARVFFDALKANNVGFAQMILEFGAWVHVAVPRPGVDPKNELLTASKVDNGKGKFITVYTRGIK